MTRIHGRFGRVYMGLSSSSAEAEPVAYLNAWSIDFSADKEDVTAFGDGNKVYVAGLPDASGDFGGWYDDATVQTFSAASDGAERKFYLYPDNRSTTKYFYGKIFPDFSVSGEVSGGVKISSKWNAQSTIGKAG